MSRILKRIAAGVVIAGVAALLLAAGGYAAGARVNTTKSIPVGLYWTSSAPVEKGPTSSSARRSSACSMTPRRGLHRGRLLPGRLRLHDEARFSR